MIVVADASAVGAFLLADEAGPFADYARMICSTNPIRVPSIWPTEVANLVLGAHRRKRINDVERDGALIAAEAMCATVLIDSDHAIATVVETATRLGLSAYDTSYALLARRLDAPLLTGDVRLRKAAESSGLKVLTP